MLDMSSWPSANFGSLSSGQWPSNESLQFGQNLTTQSPLAGALGTTNPSTSLTGTNLFGSALPAKAGGFDFGGLGMNMGTAQLALGGLNSIGNLWGAFQAQSLAKKQFGLQKDTLNTNLGNQIKAYNTGIDDKIRSRAVVEGLSPEQVAEYKKQNEATR